MKIAALGDIHSNHFALEACLEYIDKHNIKTVAFLGDYVSDCPCPEKTVQLLHYAKDKYRTYFVRGNREDYIICHHDNPNDGWRYGSRFGSLLYTYERLNHEDIEWFRNMPLNLRISLEGAEDIEICHGSFSDNRTHLLPGSDAIFEAFYQMSTNTLLCAHTHKAYIVNCETDKKTIINGGALGSGPSAEFVVMKYEGKWNADFVSLPFDVDGIEREFYESGFIKTANVWARAVLKTMRVGGDYPIRCLLETERLRSENSNTHDEEYYWEEAARSLGV